MVGRREGEDWRTRFERRRQNKRERKNEEEEEEEKGGREKRDEKNWQNRRGEGLEEDDA